jgi:hemolysin-activating ACP:hemolysin acyltransferase
MIEKYTLCGVSGRIRTDTLEYKRAALLGVLLQFVALSPYHRDRPFREIVGTLSMAQNMHQLKVYFNDYGDCVGYVAWALLSRDVVAEFHRSGPRRLDAIEWNEGFIPWIVDFLVRPGSLPYVVDDLRSNIFSAYRSASYIKTRKNVSQLKTFASRSRSAGHDIKTTSRRLVQPDVTSPILPTDELKLAAPATQ